MYIYYLIFLIIFFIFYNLKKNKNIIPLNVYQICNDKNKLNYYQKIILNKNKNKNPNINFILLDIIDIKDFMKKYKIKVYEYNKIKYIILYYLGGIYLDINTIITNNISNYISNNDVCLLSKNIKNEYKDDILIYSKKHPYLKHIINSKNNNYNNSINYFINNNDRFHTEICFNDFSYIYNENKDIFYNNLSNNIEYFNIKCKIKNININNQIPKLLIQTVGNKNTIHNKIYKNVKMYANNYMHLIFDDDDCIQFFKKYKKYFPNNIILIFNKLKGAHKADLFRYCFLYVHGGIYIDIKTELIEKLDKTFDKKLLYTVLSIVPNTIYQGIIASPALNPIFKDLITFICNNYELSFKEYTIFTKDFYDKIKYCTKKDILLNEFCKNKRNNIDIYLFKEKCNDPSLCYDGLDRYNLCCFVWNKNKRVIKTRYSDYEEGGWKK